MAFVKFPKLCPDAPAGFRLVNGLAANLETLKSELELEHVALDVADTSLSELTIGGPGNYAYPGSPTNVSDAQAARPGTHENELVPRGTAFVKQVTDGDPSIIGSYGVQLHSTHGALTSMQVLDTGVYFFPVNGFAEVWGRVSPIADSTTGAQPPVDARVQPGTPTGTGSTGLIVKTFRLQNPDGVNDIMYPFHTGFFLWLYGRRNAAPAPLALGSAGAMLRRPNLNPRNHMRPFAFLKRKR